MLLKEKLYLVAGSVDESIKSSTAIYDVKIFKSFMELEAHVNKSPTVIDTLVVSADELVFNSINMSRLLQVVNSPFMKIKSSVIYLIDEDQNIEPVTKFLEDNNLRNWSVYQGDLQSKFIADILSGERRDTVEGQVDVVVYRIRSDEYVRQQQLKKDYENIGKKYVTDEDMLAGIPDEKLPTEVVVTEDGESLTTYIVGADEIERTLICMVVAQYRALQGKTLLVEKDWEYHRLSDMITKAGIQCTTIDIFDLFKDCNATLTRVRECKERLVVFVAKERMYFDYNFVMDILETNLRSDLDYIVRECAYEETPYGRPYTVITRNTVPDILKCCNSLRYSINPNDVVFVGVTVGNLRQLSITNDEMRDIVECVLEKSNVNTCIVEAEGLTLKGDELSYDILSIIARAGW